MPLSSIIERHMPPTVDYTCIPLFGAGPGRKLEDTDWLSRVARVLEHAQRHHHACVGQGRQTAGHSPLPFHSSSWAAAQAQLVTRGYRPQSSNGLRCHSAWTWWTPRPRLPTGPPRHRRTQAAARPHQGLYVAKHARVASKENRRLLLIADSNAFQQP